MLMPTRHDGIGVVAISILPSNSGSAALCGQGGNPRHHYHSESDHVRRHIEMAGRTGRPKGRKFLVYGISFSQALLGGLCNL